MFNKVSPADIAALKSIIEEESRVLVGEEILEDFTHDEMPEYGKFLPEVVVQVLSTEEVSKVMRYAYEHDLPVIPRGAGTGLCGGAVPIHGGIVLSTARMNRIIEINESTLTATVEPGVLLMELAQAALNVGLLYPPDPGEKSATLGGNIMTNAGGMRAVKYGVTRDYVRALEVVMPNGDILQLGSNVAKNSSGYSIKDLVIGSEGTLCIATKLVLELIPAPKKTLSLLVPFASIEQAIEAVPQILVSNLDPTALEFMQKEIIEMAEKFLGKSFPDRGADAYLLLTLDRNSQSEMDDAVDRCAKLLLSIGALDVFVADTAERLEGLWTTRGNFLEAIKASTPELDECDVVVPRNKIAVFLKFVSTLSDRFSVRLCSFGHAGDGNLHIYVCRDDIPKEKFWPLCEEVMTCMYDYAKEIGGQVSGEHGIGHAKIDFLVTSGGENYIALLKAVKAAFDPKGLLNPGKVIRG